jgi:acyl-CoA reductase-like NAD-dependent aldehyde dehydrogenase
VGGGNHAHVDADQLAAADAEELALGQHPQQARLQRRRHVADLVEEQRAAVGLLEAADMAPGRPVKAPASWPNIRFPAVRPGSPQC